MNATPKRPTIVRDSESSMTLAALAERCGKSVVVLRFNEMGEDVRKLLVDYLRLLSVIRQAVSAETPVVRNALAWAAKVLGQ